MKIEIWERTASPLMGEPPATALILVRRKRPLMVAGVFFCP